MTITITWQAVAAIAVSLGAVATYFSWFVRVIVRSELRRLNGYYIRSEKSTLTGAEIERRLLHLEGVPSLPAAR